MSLEHDKNDDTGWDGPAKPIFVRTAAAAERWRLSLAIAIEMTGESTASEVGVVCGEVPL